MATAPVVPNFEQYNFSLNDTEQVLVKDNGRNAALRQFGQGLTVMVESINQDLQTMESQKTATQGAAQTATTKASEANTFANQTAEDRGVVAQQRSFVETKALEVEQARQATLQAAQSASDDANRAEQATSVLVNGAVNDEAVSELDTWSSHKLNALIGNIDSVLDEINGGGA